MDGVYPDEVTTDDVVRLLQEAKADVLLVGHTHLAFSITTLGGGTIANPGALLHDPAEPQENRAMIFDADKGTFVPGPAPGGGTFGILELPSKHFTVHRAADGVEIEIPRRQLGVSDRR